MTVTNEDFMMKISKKASPSFAFSFSLARAFLSGCGLVALALFFYCATTPAAASAASASQQAQFLSPKRALGDQTILDRDVPFHVLDRLSMAVEDTGKATLARQENLQTAVTRPVLEGLNKTPLVRANAFVEGFAEVADCGTECLFIFDNDGALTAAWPNQVLTHKVGYAWYQTLIQQAPEKVLEGGGSKAFAWDESYADWLTLDGILKEADFQYLADNMSSDMAALAFAAAHPDSKHQLVLCSRRELDRFGAADPYQKLFAHEQGITGSANDQVERAEFDKNGYSRFPTGLYRHFYGLYIRKALLAKWYQMGIYNEQPRDIVERTKARLNGEDFLRIFSGPDPAFSPEANTTTDAKYVQFQAIVEDLGSDKVKNGVFFDDTAKTIYSMLKDDKFDSFRPHLIKTVSHNEESGPVPDGTRFQQNGIMGWESSVAAGSSMEIDWVKAKEKFDAAKTAASTGT